MRAQCRLAQLHLGGYSEAVLRNEALFALPAEPQEPDYAAALPWAHAAAQTGDAEGQTLLGQILANPPPELRDEAASIAAYAAAAAQRHAPAQLGLGIALLLRARSPEDWETAYKEIAAAAEAGLPAAYYLLGLCAEKGLGQTPDTAAAQKHYTVAAEAEIVAAQTRLGCMLINARASNLVGETWLRRAALRGDTEAATLVGQLHAGDAEAVQWFRMAAEGGGLTGAFNYARCLATGSGVPRDMAGATFWLTNAAEAGFAEAQAALGAAHIDGRTCRVIFGARNYGCCAPPRPDMPAPCSRWVSSTSIPAPPPSARPLHAAGWKKPPPMAMLWHRCCWPKRNEALG